MGDIQFNGTPVEWLIETMAKTPMTDWYNVREQAKAMEKEQIIEADLHASLRTALGSDFTLSERRVKELAEQYYNETYENNK